MEEKSIVLSRDKLYEMVWSVPMWKLAPEYGISDVGLKKICHRMGIPTPQRGYWAKLEAGHKVKAESLPIKEKNKYEESYTFYPKPERTAPATEPDIYSEELDKVKDIVVMENLVSPHPLVAETRKLLSKEKGDDYGMLPAWRQGCLHLRVSQQSLVRALRIIDAVIKGLGEMGYTVEREKDNDKDGPFVCISGEQVHFSVEEKATRSDHTLTEKEQKEKARGGWIYPHKWDFHPTGKLSFVINDYCNCPRRRWSDGKKALEDLLQEILLGILVAANSLKERRIEMDEQAKKWREEEERRIAEAQRRELERTQLEELESMAGCFRRSNLLRDLIIQVEKKVMEKPYPQDVMDAFIRWKAMASQFVDRLDPLQNIESILKKFSTDEERRKNGHL